jgi:hypothetical protein
MAWEGDYTLLTRIASFTQHVFEAGPVHH